MKKPKRSRHRIPNCALELKCDPISEQYQAEIDASTAKLEMRHRKALMSLEAADRRASRIDAALQRTAAKSARNKAKQEQRKIQQAIEEREAELCQIEKLMVPSTYASRDSRRRIVRMESGAITVPIGALAVSLPSSKPDGGQHILYRHWSNSVLLYVGRTADGGRRTGEHAREKRWWLEQEVTNVTVEFYPNKEILKAAELHAIRTENPKYNIKGVFKIDKREEQAAS